jgi:hypothetical protein
MARIVIIGNAGGGKSTLARKLAERRGLPLVEIDRLYWKSGWAMAPEDEYEAAHAQAIGGEAWIIDGLGRLESLAQRFARATGIVLVDMPLWVHFWLIAERQIAWATGKLDHPPGGIPEMPSTEEMFSAAWETERDWMPAIRALCDAAEREGKSVEWIGDVKALNDYAARL